MGLLRWMALGAAGAVAYKLWKQRQAATATAASYRDNHSMTSPHGDPLLGAATASWDPEPSVPAAQFSRGFGGGD